jgi:hypothetical protein
MKIYAPVKNATGVWCNVHFLNGVGETDDPHLIKWFTSHGYKVENSEILVKNTVEKTVVNEEVEPKDEEVKPDLESMTPLEIREWARLHGYGSKIKNTRNKEKLIEIING